MMGYGKFEPRTLPLGEISLSDDEVVYDIERPKEDVAKENGCKIILPELHQLFLDLDTEEAYIEMHRKLTIFEKTMGWRPHIEVAPSKSGLPHRHAVLTFVDDGSPMPFPSEWERICMQYFFGSEPNREMMNTLRLRLTDGADSGNCFFERKVK